MFDQHMTSLVQQYKGKYVVLSSGGIDGNMCAAWMYKNKIDFEIRKDQETYINCWETTTR